MSRNDECGCEDVIVYHPLDGYCRHKACAIDEQPDCGDVTEGKPTPGRCVDDAPSGQEVIR